MLARWPEARHKGELPRMEDMSAEDRREAAADRFFAFAGRSTAAFLVRLGESVGRNVSERSGAYGRQLCFLQATMFVGRGMPGRQRERLSEPQAPSPKSSRLMWRIPNQAGNAAARTKGSIFQIVYRC